MKALESVLLGSIITEKATDEKQRNRYVLKVLPGSTKIDIKNAVEKLFKVEVVDVNTINVRGKVLGAIRGKMGRTKNWKKAYVTLKPGQKIESLEAQA